MTDRGHPPPGARHLTSRAAHELFRGLSAASAVVSQAEGPSAGSEDALLRLRAGLARMLELVERALLPEAPFG